MAMTDPARDRSPDAAQAQATYLLRQAALTRTSERLRGRPPVPDAEREAVLDAVHDATVQRAEQLSPPGPGTSRGCRA